MNRGQQARAGTFLPPGGMYAALMPNWVRERAKDFFVYSGDFLPLAAGATASVDIAIQNDSDFLVVAGVGNVTTDAAPPVDVPVPQLTVRLLDSGSGRQLQNRVQHWANLFGTAQLPGYWPYPKYVDRASVVNIQVTNLDAAAAFNVRASLWGFKVFDFPADVDQRV